MCVVKVPEVPNVETRFFTDTCDCHPEPVEMVELRGQDTQQTVVYRIDKIRRLPGHWAAIRERYAAWKAPPSLLLTDRRNAQIRVTPKPPKASRRKVESRTGTR